MNNCMCNENSPKAWNWWNTSHENKTKHMVRSTQAVAEYGFDGVKLDGCGPFLNLTWWAQLLNATGSCYAVLCMVPGYTNHPGSGEGVTIRGMTVVAVTHG